MNKFQFISSTSETIFRSSVNSLTDFVHILLYANWRMAHQMSQSPLYPIYLPIHQPFLRTLWSLLGKWPTMSVLRSLVERKQIKWINRSCGPLTHLCPSSLDCTERDLQLERWAYKLFIMARKPLRQCGEPNKEVLSRDTIYLLLPVDKWLQQWLTACWMQFCAHTTPMMPVSPSVFYFLQLQLQLLLYCVLFLSIKIHKKPGFTIQGTRLLCLLYAFGENFSTASWQDEVKDLICLSSHFRCGNLRVFFLRSNAGNQPTNTPTNPRCRLFVLRILNGLK